MLGSKLIVYEPRILGVANPTALIFPSAQGTGRKFKTAASKLTMIGIGQSNISTAISRQIVRGKLKKSIALGLLFGASSGWISAKGSNKTACDKRAVSPSSMHLARQPDIKLRAEDGAMQHFFRRPM